MICILQLVELGYLWENGLWSTDIELEEVFFLFNRKLRDSRFDYKWFWIKIQQSFFLCFENKFSTLNMFGVSDNGDLWSTDSEVIKSFLTNLLFDTVWVQWHEMPHPFIFISFNSLTYFICHHPFNELEKTSKLKLLRTPDRQTDFFF